MKQLIRMLGCAAVLVMAMGGGTAWGLSVSEGTLRGRTCDVVQWTDANGRMRRVHLVRADGDVSGYRGGYIERMEYFVGDTAVVADASGPGGDVAGLGVVNCHYYDDPGGGDSTSRDPADTTGAVSGFVFQGSGHALWRFTGQFSGLNAARTMRVGGIGLVLEYLFFEGRNDFLWTVSFDLSALPSGAVNWDARGPYFEFDWNGNGAFASDPISGIRWGDKYKFRTTAYTHNSPATVAWDYTQPNTIPYTLLWHDAATGDSEAGVVATQPWTRQDAGWGFGWPPVNGWGKTGVGMMQSFEAPYQLNSFNTWSGEKIAWGAPYGNDGAFVGSASYKAMDYTTVHSGHPYQGYSVHVILNRHTEGLTDAMIGASEAVQGTVLSAMQGTVVAEGPRYAAIPGSQAPYQPEGWDHNHAAWAVAANASNDVAVQVTVPPGQTLVRPVFRIAGYRSAQAPDAVRWGGTALAAGTGYFATVFDAGDELWLTLAQAVTGTGAPVLLEIEGGPVEGTTGGATTTGITTGGATGGGTTGTSGTSGGATGVSGSGSDSGGSSAGTGTDSGGTGTSSGAGTGGLASPERLDWTLTVKRPKEGRRIRVRSGKGVGTVAGHWTTDLDMGAEVTVEVAVTNVQTTGGSLAWVAADVVRPVNKKGRAKFRAKAVGDGTVDGLESGDAIGIGIRATDGDFELRSTETNWIRVERR